MDNLAIGIFLIKGVALIATLTSFVTTLVYHAHNDIS